MTKPTIRPGTELQFRVYFSEVTFVSILATSGEYDLLADGNFQFNWDLQDPKKPVGTNKRTFVTMTDWLAICEVIRLCRDPEIDWKGIGTYIFMTGDDLRMPSNFLALIRGD